MKLFDTHAHLGLIQEEKLERLLVVQMARSKGVSKILSICNSLADFDEVYDDLKTETGVFHAVGVSPSEAGNPGANWADRVVKNASKDRIVAIGEIGLDYAKMSGSKNQQIELFLQQLEIAKKLSLPVVIHNREAGKDILEILRDKIPEKGAIFHCFSEDWAFAMKALDLPVYFSFAGNLTYKSVRDLHETCANLPADRILIESESPFMIPAVYKGKRNKPAYLIENAKAVAYFQDKPLEEMCEILYANSLKAFGLKD